MSELKLISEGVVEGDAKKVGELTKRAIDEGIDVVKILDDGLIAGMEMIGELFERKEAFVPELLLAARAMRAGMELLNPLCLE